MLTLVCGLMSLFRIDYICYVVLLMVYHRTKANTEGKTLVTGALFLAGGQAGGS